MNPEFKEVILTEDEFDERFNMVKNHIDTNASFNECMFETFDEELEYIQEFAKENPKRVWTILDCDGDLYFSSGFSFVNRFGYFITEEEVEENTFITVKLEMVEDESEEEI